MDLFAKPRRSAITHADGSSLSIFNGQPVAGDANFYNGTCGSHDLSFSTDAVPVSTAVGSSYFLADQLGTTQMDLSGSGTVLWQGAFTPFGQEIINGTTASYVGPQPADGTTNRYKFTGKERDSESGLDYFGARYYASGMGRWTTPDWSAKAEPVPYSKLDDPQSLNLYVYVGNNPIRRADLDGHLGMGVPGSDQACLHEGKCLTGDPDPAHLQDPANNQQAQQQSSGSAANAPSFTSNAIANLTYTSAIPGILLGGAIGEAVEPAGGGIIGSILGSTIGIGPSASYVPSTDSTYLGGSLTVTARLFGGEGFNASYLFAPTNYRADAIANGLSFSVSTQPFIAGVAGTYSPGNGWAVGPSAGGRTPVSVGVSYSFDVSRYVRPVEHWIKGLFQ